MNELPLAPYQHQPYAPPSRLPESAGNATLYGMTRTLTKAIRDVRPGEAIGDRVVKHTCSTDYFVTVDFGDSEPLIRPWYTKVVVTTQGEKNDDQ